MDAKTVGIPQGGGALDDCLGYQRRVLIIQDERENIVVLITKCGNVTGRLIMKAER